MTSSLEVVFLIVYKIVKGGKNSEVYCNCTMKKKVYLYRQRKNRKGRRRLSSAGSYHSSIASGEKLIQSLKSRPVSAATTESTAETLKLHR